MEKRNISFIQNLSISYECALAIGNSLDLKKMLHEVIHKIVHKTNAHRGSIWLCNGKKGNRIILGARAGSKLSVQEIKKRVAFYFDIFEKIFAAKKPVIKNRSEKDFNKYCIDKTSKEQVVLIIPVDKIVIIHLVYTDKEIVDETLINMITGLSPKLIVAIEACKAYQTLLKEIQVRKETEDELKKKTAQLSNGEKKLQKLYKESEDSRKSLISIMEDVVEKENALLKSEEKYRQVVDNSLVGIYITQNHILKFCNQRFAEIFGYENYNELLDKSIKNLVTPESWDLVNNEVKLRESGEKVISRYEFKGIKKYGAKIDIEVLGARILFVGKPAIQGTLIDISERKKHEQELKIALEKAKESDRLKSVFLTTMSHELRTPLNAVIGFSELIDESLPIDVITDFSETINDSGTHLLNIIEDIFDISTLETGDMKVVKEEFSLKKAIKEISDSIKAEQKKEKKECLNIYFCPDKKVQDTIIYTDRHKLKQIMINLLKNAIKFTLEGHIEYGYEIEDEKNILFFVKDTGVGIPKDKQEIIFDRFRQADDSFTRKFGGTGLGLAIVKHLVEILGGKIWLSSETDKGSEFYFTLPCNIADDSIKKTSEADITKTCIDLSGKVILVVDDMKSVYQYMKAILRKTNVRLIWAKDGQEAIDICKENRNINLVLMDIQMPVLNGFEATKHIKQFRKDLPIIAQTAYALKGDREMSLNAGCDDYITKPIDTKVLFTTIEKHI